MAIISFISVLLRNKPLAMANNLQDNGLPEDMAQELLRRELDASQSILALNVKRLG